MAQRPVLIAGVFYGCIRFGAAHEQGVWRKRYKSGLDFSSDIPTAILS